MGGRGSSYGGGGSGLKVGTDSVYYENGKIIVTDRSQLYNIADHFKAYEEYLKHDKQEYFYRATNNENEHLIKEPISTNHLTGEKEKGLSTHYTPVYHEKFEAGNQSGSKYIAVVKGKVVGFGADKEPLLKNVEFVQKPVKNLPSKYSRENVVKTRQLTKKETPWRKLNFSPFGNDIIIK